MLFAITFDDESDEYTIMASVGGTQVASLTTGELAKVKPTAVYVGDENQQKIDPIEPLGIWCDNNNATTEANGRIALETLNFWDA
ncbi:MAG: hypothetical protein IT435_08340 [Phycisphaerales bacterium]|nr:hypothetical protein [Phycisphaerales bacterium]